MKIDAGNKNGSLVFLKKRAGPNVNDMMPQSLSSGVELGYEQVENDVELPNDDRVLRYDIVGI